MRTVSRTCLSRLTANAVSGCPGPVHLQFQGNEGQVDLGKTDLEQRTEMRFTHVPPFRPQGDPADIRRLDILQNAKNQ